MGETVIKQGDAGEEFFIIIKGSVSIFVENKADGTDCSKDCDSSDHDEYTELLKEEEKVNQQLIKDQAAEEAREKARRDAMFESNDS